MTLAIRHGNTITPNSAARWDNAITYTTPNWGGFRQGDLLVRRE
ncbi:MAG: hypothetical protein V5B44_23900 [Candidatus Accumulibacter necessarius]